jgi:hypothetical protein
MQSRERNLKFAELTGSPMKDEKFNFHSTEMVVRVTIEDNELSTSKVWHGGG